jgi:hypothetical protein
MKTTLRSFLTLGLMITLIGSFSSFADAATKKPYPLTICLVTDSKLGSMGDPVTAMHEGQEVKFCCKPCLTKFHKDPAKYLKKL